MPEGAPREETPSGHLEDVIAMRVRELRLAKGISLAELARLTGMSKAMLSKIENAQTSCSLSSLARLADALAVPVTALGWATMTPPPFTPMPRRYAAMSNPGVRRASSAMVILLYVLVASRLSTWVQWARAIRVS